MSNSEERYDMFRTIVRPSVVLLLLLTATTVAGAVDPYVILDKNIAAMGGWDKINAQHEIHWKGTLVIEGASLNGTIEMWNRPPDRSRQEFDIKVIRQVSGDNGQFAWRVDQNGKLQISRDSASLKERELGIRMAAREHMKRDSKVFAVTFDRLDTAAGQTCYVLKTTNTINSFVSYDFYDTASYLPIKNVTVKPDGETQTISGDFRDVSGVLYPFRLQQLELPVQQRTTIVISSVDVNQPIASSLFEPPSEEKKDFRFPAGKSMIEVPFKFIELHIFVPLTINGKTKLWIIDSGAEVTVVEKEFADTLGLVQEGKLTGVGAVTTADFSFTVLPPFELNGIAFDSQKVAVFSINDLFRKSSGIEIGGILGYDFLSRLVTRVDYAKQLLTFYEPDSFVYKGDGVVLDAPLTKSNMFQIPITVDDSLSGSWDLDLGASGLDFLYPYAESHGLLTRSGISRMSFGAGGGQLSTTIQFQTISMAGFTKSKPLIDIQTAKGTGAFSHGELAGNAGNDFFRHFTLYLDYKREKVIVEKGTDFAKDFPTDHSGLQLMVGDSGRLDVLLAPESTPAAKAGLLKGDAITAINGKSIGALGGILAVREMMRGLIGTNYKIDLIRDGKPTTVKLKLKNLYD